jgi:hypothetical protein
VGDGTADDTAAIQAALDAAGQAGGGIVLFPRGRYQVRQALTVPRFTVLRGEGEDLVNIFWPDMDAPPPVLIQGTNSFGLEELTLYCSNYRTFLAGDTTGSDAGNVSLRQVRIRANVFRGHMKPEEVDQRWREGMKVGFGGGYWLLKLGGRNIRITDCDLYSASCIYSLTQPRGAVIERNILGAGRWGGSGVFGGEGVILADNKYVGVDLMSWGAAGGLWQPVPRLPRPQQLRHGARRGPRVHYLRRVRGAVLRPYRFLRGHDADSTRGHQDSRPALDRLGGVRSQRPGPRPVAPGRGL